MEQKIKIRILIADDHQMFIDGLKALLQPEATIEVVAQALRGDVAYDIICGYPLLQSIFSCLHKCYKTK